MAAPQQIDEYRDSRDTPVADLVASGAKLVKSYVTLHKKETSLARDITHVVVRIRAKHQDKHGRPDLRGKSQEYRDAVAAMYRKAGIPEDARSNLQGLIRYHMSETLRAYMEANGYTDADFEYYGLDRQSAKDKARDRQRDKAERLAASVLALDRVAPERLPAASATVVGQTAGSLRALSENAAALSSLSVLQGDERDALLRDLEAVETAAAVIRASL